MIISSIIFYITWPISWFLVPLTRRVRVVVMKDEKILVVKNRFGPGIWQLPGGGIKFGESVSDAAAREMKEELDVAVGLVRETHKDPVVFRQFGLIMRCHFVSTTLSGASEVSKNWEIEEYAWIPIDGLPRVSAEVRKGLQIVKMV